jgi:hypothetical protein
MRRILFLSEDQALRALVNPLAQWLDLHAPPRPIDALENIKNIQPECFVIDANVLSPMVTALLTTIRNLPSYKSAPLILIGESPSARRLQSDKQFPRQFNLRRLEESIADLLQIRLVGRGTHGPHRGSVY